MCLQEPSAYDTLKLTKRNVEALSWPQDAKGNQFFIWDDQIKGLGLRLTPKGKKSFVVQYRINGASRRMTLGSFPVLNPDHARELALKHLASALDGEDPQLLKKERRKAGITVADLYETFYEDHVKKHRSEKGQRELGWDFKRVVLPAIGGIQAKALSRADLRPMMEELEVIPRTHNVIRGYLKTMYGYGIREGIVDSSPIDSIHPLPEKSRSEWIKPADLKKLFKRVAEDSNHYVRAFFPLLALTACRKSELQFAQWSQIDFENRIFTIPVTKNGTSHEVHLTDHAIKILEGIVRQEGNPYIFCGLRGKVHHDFLKPWDRIRKAVSLRKYIIHDIRRTAASYLAQDGVSSDRISQILNHKDPTVTGIYARLHHNDKVLTFERLAELLEEIGVLNVD